MWCMVERNVNPVLVLLDDMVLCCLIGEHLRVPATPMLMQEPG